MNSSKPARVRSASSSFVALVLLSAALQAGCSKRESADSAEVRTQAQALSEGAGGSDKSGGMIGAANAAPAASAQRDEQTAPASAVATQRRVIHKAELTLESDSPDSIQAELTSLATSKGGFVVGGDVKRTRSSEGEEFIDATVEFRVPSSAFDSTLAALRGLSNHILDEKVTGEDVTEEYVDAEARIRAKRALEAQYTLILKDAKTIPEILAVQEKLGEVRTEIERAEGRRRYLENESDLSTFTVHASRHVDAPKPPPVEQGPGFGRSIKAASRDTIDGTIAIVNALIRAIGVLLPVLVIFGLPMYIAGRLWLRRRRQRLAAMHMTMATPMPATPAPAPPVRSEPHV